VAVLATVVAAMDMNANMNARPLEASRRQARGVDLRVNEEVEMVAATLSVLIWDLVLVPKRLVYISYYFWELIQHLFTCSLFELAPCGISMSTLATSDSAGSSAKPSSSGPSYSLPGLKQGAESLSSASTC
jgi:hypothetical protein